jgi:hypothetical protein
MRAIGHILCTFHFLDLFGRGEFTTVDSFGQDTLFFGVYAGEFLWAILVFNSTTEKTQAMGRRSLFFIGQPDQLDVDRARPSSRNGIKIPKPKASLPKDRGGVAPTNLGPNPNSS